MRNRDRRW